MNNQDQLEIPIQPVENPILCNPYEEPYTHWLYDTETGEAIRQPGRREAGYSGTEPSMKPNRTVPNTPVQNGGYPQSVTGASMENGNFMSAETHNCCGSNWQRSNTVAPYENPGRSGLQPHRAPV